MKSRGLKRTRLFVAIVALISTGILFLDFRHVLPEKAHNIILWFQFVPSAVKFINTGHAAALGFIAILLLAALSGRTYCSFICPLGIMQDIFSRVGGRIKKRFRRYGYKNPHTKKRYTILALTIFIAIAGGIYILTLLDPYSIFGRFMTFFAVPGVIWVNNLLASVLWRFDDYSLAITHIPSYRVILYVLPAAFLVLTGVLSLIRGRLYCNMICPVGTLLGLISKFSALRIKIDDSGCVKCGRCAISCKSSCIDFISREIDNSRCVVCFNCVNRCPEKAIVYGLAENKGKAVKVDAGKRAFIAGSAAFLLGIKSDISAAGSSVQEQERENGTSVKEPRNYFVTPPGSGSLENFTNRCTACSLCVSACPTRVLVPSFSEYGLSGIMQPRMDYHKGFCAYECVRCSEICPTGALMPLRPEAKKLTQIGKVVFIKENCIVETRQTVCGACAEVCPTKAVKMVPYIGNLRIPVTNDDICIGCGHCEYACPVSPYKAIFVDGNPVHKAAGKPESVQTDLEHKEFPF